MKDGNRLLISAVWIVSAIAGVLAFTLFDTNEPKTTPANQKLAASYGKGGEFTLDTAQGKISLSDFKGKVVVLYFGYRSCPDICPSSLHTLGSALKKLSAEELEKTQAIFISVDPERDTPDILKDYSSYFHPKMIGATTSIDKVKELATRYRVIYQKMESDSAMGYLVDHSSNIHIVDTTGKLQESLAHGSTTDQVAAGIRRYIK